MDVAEKPRNTSDFGVGAGGHDDTRAPAERHQSAGVGHRTAVAERGARLDGIGVLLRGDRLTRQHGLVDPQRFGGDQAQVGRNAVARLQVHDVARHQLTGGQLDTATAADHLRRLREHRLDRRERPFRAAFLDKADQRVDQNDGENDPGIDPVPEERRAGCGQDQDVNQDVVKMPQKVAHWVGPRRRQLVRSVDREAFGGLCVTEAGGMV